MNILDGNTEEQVSKDNPMDAFTVSAVVVGALGLVAVVIIAGLVVRFYLGRRVDQMWTAGGFPAFKDIGAVKHLAVLPLIDMKAERRDLVREAGVSYLIRADDTTILFDVGVNARGEHPSPLLRNMEALGVTLKNVQYIVISHLHLDHVGGFKYQRERTFDLSSQPLDLRGIPAFVPTAMTHSTAKVQVVDRPQVIAPGIATLGPIPRQLFFFGRTLEQSLAINVQDKGIVLIIGCGHPTLEWIVERAQRLFDRPIYGVIGGLHYPVTALPRQRLLGTNKWPWDPINAKDVGASIEFLQQRHPGLVAVSSHDSCDQTIELFRQAFPEAYQDLLVGKEIAV